MATSSKVSDLKDVTKTKSCEWRGCTGFGPFPTIEEIVEHVLAEHIPKVVKDEGGEEEVVCEWAKCELGTTRGTLEKKTQWIQEHFKARHAKGAKTHKCVFEGCHEARATSQEIETHVRSVHIANRTRIEREEKMEKSRESTSASTSSAPAAPPNRVWQIIDGRVYYPPPPVVTKKTIVYYDDGPRYVYPPGTTARCPKYEDESELASDEYWSDAVYSDDEEIIRKSWRPPRHWNPLKCDEPRRFEYPEWYDPKNPPVTDSEEEARRRRPKRVKKKVLTKTMQQTNRLHAVVDRINEDRGKTREELEMEKVPGWKGSFWHRYLEEQKKKEKAPPREVSAPPELVAEPKESPIRKRQLVKMPKLRKVDEDSEEADSESEPEEEGEKDRVKTRKIKRKRRKFQDSGSSDEDDETPPLLQQVQLKKSPLVEAQSPENSSKKRPSRSCVRNVSLYEVEEDIEAFEVMLETPPKIVPRIGKLAKPSSPPAKNLKRIVKTTVPQKQPKTSKTNEPEIPEKPSRPSRACRVLGSMEEVPFDMEIACEDEKPRQRKRKMIRLAEEEEHD
ncbi:unnamed protein product [Caenorhabditis sp. 36 PRJEB53466]|nr:unnamed protein product [Caenorhabditis sp. 36 PRJEB53466]